MPEAYGTLSIIGTKGNDSFVNEVNSALNQFRRLRNQNYIIKPELVRFATGEAKCVLHDSMRGHDIFILADMYNYGVKYKMYGMEYPMSPDDHFQDLKRIIGAIGGKAKRICVIMPLLYESRQDKRTARESLDCAIALQELVHMGVSNIITFDVHNSSVQNAIPLNGFDNVQPTYQMLKTLLQTVPDVKLDPQHCMIISPDTGGMSRCVYYASVLELELGMFYKRRDYSVVQDGKNPVIAHEYLGKDVSGKDLIIADDIIASGDSMLEVAMMLKEKGANRIFLFASFGLFSAGFEKLDQAYRDGIFTKILTTNLIYRSPELLKREWYGEVNMSTYVARLMDTLNYDRSISRLLDPSEKIRAMLANPSVNSQIN